MKFISAEDRAVELWQLTMDQLPPRALAYLGYIRRKYGWCGEVVINCLTAYAELAEGCPCADTANLADQEAHDWFAANPAAHVAQDRERVITLDT